MNSSHLADGQGYNSAVSSMYTQQMATKNPLQTSSGLYNYGALQNIPPFSNYQGPGQTLNKTPLGPASMAAAQSGPVAQIPPVLQNSAATSTSAGSFHSGVNLPAHPHWQYGQTPSNQLTVLSQANHFAYTAATQPLLSSSGNTNIPTSYHSVSSSGGPPIQNSYTKPVSELVAPVPLPVNQLAYSPVRPPLGPPTVGSPAFIQSSAPSTAPPASVASQNSASPQEGDATCTASDGSLLQNNYDTIEGGGFLATAHSPSTPQNLKMSRHVGGAYPSLPPGYQTTSSPGGLRMPLFRCTLTNIPQTQALLNKAKLPLGLLLHPFKDLSQLPVVTSSTIVRCRSCRTYINPFVSFLDQRRWKCNLCYRVNDVPEEFMYNPVTRVYGEPHKRPEVQNATIEFMAPSEYMLRPPQPPVYLFVFDVSHNAIETGYLNTVCKTLLDNLDLLPGNTRTKIGFITFDSTIHFYSLQEGLSQPQMLIVSDIDDKKKDMPPNQKEETKQPQKSSDHCFGHFCNFGQGRDFNPSDQHRTDLTLQQWLIQDLLRTLPQMFTHSLETQSALGPALQAAFKLMSPTGGRISVFQTQLPSVGMGALKPREEPNQKASAKDIHLTPSTDFYKKLALDCSGQQVAVDLFLLSGQYSDLASLGCISRYSAGSVYYYQSYHHQHNPLLVEKLQKELKRYLTRKIGFEAVMRIRCTKGLSIHTFHGNFFVRSTDLLSLPNVNPDAGYAVQMSVEESLTDMQVVCFQSALLYTSSKGERRIRVHTMCLPVVSQLSDVYLGADVQAITGLLANMAVDRSVSASLSDARDALVNAVIDSLSAYRSSVLTIQQPGLMAPVSLRLFPLYVLALLKQKAFQTGTNTRLDDRIFTMCQVKNQPLVYLMLMMHPNLYRIDNLTDEGALNISDRTIPQPPILQLSVEKINRDGAYLMDAGSVMYLWVGKNCGQNFISHVLGVPNYASIPHNMHCDDSGGYFCSINRLEEEQLKGLRGDESPWKPSFLQNMIEDRTESALSYYEFLLHIQQQVNK
ncbi:hypothetical protein JD844_012152 [Phrynosoma platyrhinos]|uniref:Protein transport protein Sec24A n=1 Tax=Phrynosoma platyrhinos TaxID=52577 RepID=A0ABQ7TJD6_PHRPL|nr:hypothetical protein JD844_012152 [Phrynosoma platyrhinos]